MPQTSRWVVAVAVACAALGAVVLARHALRTPEPEIPATVPARPPGFRVTPRAAFQPAAPRPYEGSAAEVDVPGAVKVPPAAKPPRPASAGERHRAAAPEAPPVEVAAETPGRASLTEGVSLSVSFDGSTVAADQTPPLFAEGIEFDPAFGAARFPPAAVLAYPDSGGINLEEGSIAFWVRMEWDPSQPIEGKSLAELRVGTWENRFEMRMGSTYVGLLLTTSDGTEHGVGANLHWTPGDWHHIAATWGQALMQLYIDGDLRDQRAYAGEVLLPLDTPLYVGSQRKGPQNQGTVSMRAWNVFQRILTPDEIAAFMVQTAPPASAR